MTKAHGVTKDYLASLGIAWPDKHPESGEAFAGVDGFARTRSVQKVHCLPMGYPSRRIATAWETVYYDDDDEYEREIEWRDLTDEEWAAALAHYEAHKHETFGHVPSGPDIIEGRFETASGSWAKGQWDGKAWLWTEWETHHGDARRGA